MSEKELIKTEGGALASFEDFGTSSGFEDTTSDSFKTPFLKVLQRLSDELDKNHAAYIEGASAGDICNTASKELFDALNVIVLKVSHDLVVWKPNRGGFVGSYPKTEERNIVAHKKGVQKWDQDGNDVIDTLHFYLMDADNPLNIAILPMSVTSFKHAQNWATKLRMLEYNGKPAGVSWAGIWGIKTVEDRNEKGRWYTIGNSPTFKKFVDNEMIQTHILPAIEMLKTAEMDYESAGMSESNGDDAEEGTEKF